MHYHLNLDNCSLAQGYPGINAKTYICCHIKKYLKVSKSYIDNLYDKSKIIRNYQKESL